MGEHFDWQIDTLSADQLTNYFHQRIASHSWSAVKPDLYGYKFYVVHVTVYRRGLRFSERLALRVADIDAECGRVQIRDSKGNRDRFVPLPAASLDALHRWPGHVPLSRQHPRQEAAAHRQRRALLVVGATHVLPKGLRRSRNFGLLHPNCKHRQRLALLRWRHRPDATVRCPAGAPSSAAPPHGGTAEPPGALREGHTHQTNRQPAHITGHRHAHGGGGRNVSCVGDRLGNPGSSNSRIRSRLRALYPFSFRPQRNHSNASLSLVVDCSSMIWS